MTIKVDPTTAVANVDIGDVDVRWINGVAPQLDDTDKLAVSLYGKNSAAGDTPLITTQGFLGVAGQDGTSTTRKFGGYTNNSDGQGATGGILGARAIVLFNDTTWDRQRNNVEATLLASAARTATANSADQIGYNGRRLLIYIDVTSVTDTPSVTPSLQVKDSVGGGYFTVWTAATALTAAGDTVYYFADGASGGSFTEILPFGLPARTWRVAMTHADSDSITYSVSCVVLV